MVCLLRTHKNLFARMAILSSTHLLLAMFISKSTAQVSIDNVCDWTQPRAAAVRDGLYVNGGNLHVHLPGAPGLDGSIYAFNFSRSFDTQTTNFSKLFELRGGHWQNEPATDYWDGTMFATDDKIYLYGGLLPSSGDPMPPQGHVLGYQLYSSGSEAPVGPLDVDINTDVSTYITNGAGVNVPSESLGFYFGGYTAPNGSEIAYDERYLDVAVESFIQVDMSAQEPKWSNLTWPTGVTPRANPQLVWLPVSSQGVLIVIGGVINPTGLAYANFDNASETTESKNKSPSFMTSLPVYDIGSQQWFVQNTSGSVPSDWQLTEFCSVVAQAKGSSTFEIFIYGGYDGLDGSALGSVWVLSVPSFTWIEVLQGSGPDHNRSSHACVKPYPDQMFVIGGESIGGGTDAQCFDRIIDVFNLSSLTWLGHYDPTVYADYSIPSIVASSVSSTSTAVDMDPKLSAILASSYEKNITTYYPYVPIPTANTASGSKVLPAVLGAVLGLLVLTAIFFASRWFSRRKARRSVTSEIQPGDMVGNWVDGVGKPDASSTTTEIPDHGSPPLGGYYEVPGDWTYQHPRPPQAVVPLVEAEVTQRLATSRRSVHAEADGTERYEMHVLAPGSPRSHYAEADGTERYEMHAAGSRPPNGPTEMATSYHFRDHSLYPRNLAAPSESMSPTHETRSQTSGHAFAPSPYVLPQRPVGTDGVISTAASSSPPLSSPDQSPPLPSGPEHRPCQKRNISSMSNLPVASSSLTSSPGLDDLEAVSGLGYSNSRPGHTRNLSSLSSGIAQLESPLAEQVSVEEDRRRSGVLSNLPSSPVPAPPTASEHDANQPSAQDQNMDAEPQGLGLYSHRTLQHVPDYQSGRNVVTRKQLPGRSAFKEEDMGIPDGGSRRV